MRAALLGVLLICLGCGVTGSQLHTVELPASRIEAMKRFYVVHREGDNRNIEQDIAKVLVELGYEATAGLDKPADPSRYDGIVTYIDRHMWDISMYCLQLTLYVEDTQTGYITATGNSWRPSIVRENPGEHARLLFSALLGPNA